MEFCIGHNQLFPRPSFKKQLWQEKGLLIHILIFICLLFSYMFISNSLKAMKSCWCSLCPENIKNIYLCSSNLNSPRMTLNENLVDPPQIHKILCSPLFSSSAQDDLWFNIVINIMVPYWSLVQYGMPPFLIQIKENKNRIKPINGKEREWEKGCHSTLDFKTFLGDGNGWEPCNWTKKIEESIA